MELKEFKEMLDELDKIPQTSHQRTFMEICKYPGSRFEEICSRILEFFLNPKEEHRMYGLALNALLQAIGEDKLRGEYNINGVDVKTEYVTDENKRIDIVVDTPSFVIAIEHKIDANVYNPLDIYKQTIDKNYKDKRRLFVVLSAKQIPNVERDIIESRGFFVLQYSKLINVLQQNMGLYVADCNQYWLTVLIDFIKTLKNRITMFELTPEYKFFIENKERIEALNKRKEDIQKQIKSYQNEFLQSICENLKIETKAEWSIWEGWDLLVSFNNDSNKIGIESHFVETVNSPIGSFHYCITTWKKSHFEPYRDELKDKYPQCKIEDVDDRIELLFPTIENIDRNCDEIIKQLKDAYFVLKDITSRIK